MLFNRFLLYTILVLFMLPGWSSEASPLEKENTHFVYVVQQAWHTGIVLPTNLIKPETWGEISRYQDHKWIDISWGDEKFYQAQGRPFGLAVRAVCWPTQSVLRIYPFSLSIQRSYGANARVLKIPVNTEELEKLSAFINDSFQRNEKGEVQLSTIQANNSLYFLSKRKYHLFRTCNTWVALAFKEAGFDVRSFAVLNANQLFRQLEKIESTD